MEENAVPVLVSSLLQSFPELREGYAAMVEEARTGFECWTEEDVREVRSIEEMHNLPRESDPLPGVTLILENLLVPLIMESSFSYSKASRLNDIMRWVDEMAGSNLFTVRNAIGLGICEPLITNFQSCLPDIVPLMGSATKKLCIMQFSMYEIDEATKGLFL